MGHTRLTGYDRALNDLKDRAIEEGSAVRQHVAEALKALDHEYPVVDWREQDKSIDQLRDKIVNRSFELMTWQQLRPQDLRWILGYQRIALELERIADYACDLAELSQLKHLRPYPKEILDMGRHLLQMLDLDLAILKGEREIDFDIDVLDDVLDGIYAQYRQELAKEEANINSALDLGAALLLARTMERMGDHVVNVAETVLYVQTGKRSLGPDQTVFAREDT